MQTTRIKKLSMKFLEQVISGRLTMYKALKFFQLPEKISQQRLSRSGGVIRQAQVKTLMESLAPDAQSAWTSVLFPAEILHPFNIRPITLEIIAGLMSTLGGSPFFLDKAESQSVPQTMCTFHRMLIGISNSGVLPKPQFVGATSVMCDGNSESFSWVADEQKVPFIFVDVPYEESSGAIEYVKNQIVDVVNQLQDRYGIRIPDSEWKRRAVLVNQAFKWNKRFYDLRQQNQFKNLYKAYEIIGFAFTFHYLLGQEKLVRILEKMCEDLESGDKTRKEFNKLYLGDSTKRLLWLHITPQYDTPLWVWIDDAIRARIVCDEYSSPYAQPYNEGDFFGSIAKRLITHPSNGPIDRRINHILKIAKDNSVDGVVQLSNWGCHQAAGNVQLLENAFRGVNLPFLNLSADACDSRNASAEQHRTRVEAFLEQLA
ncbi:2-hydroxyacyl-CoA dehydratase family protein [bacterium]|nr:2-hydroxyacyl-CoA dehydratase family protein [bacterium]